MVPDKPLGMPFYFVPYFEKPNYTEQWNFSVSEKKIDIAIVVKGSDAAAIRSKKVQLRYIVIPEQILKDKKKSSEIVRKMPYDQLLQTFGLSS